MIKLLIFDAGDLLWRNSPKKLERRMNNFFKKYDINGKIINQRWNKIIPKVRTGKIKYGKAVKIEFKGFDVSKKGLKEWTGIHTKLIIGDFILNHHVKSTIRKLCKDYKIAILSDEVRSSDFKILVCKRLGIDIFDKVFCSTDIGYTKPHRKAYFTVLNHFKLKPNEAIFVGHSKDEIEGARKHGIRTIAIKWDRGTKSDFYVKKFSEIPKVLEKI
jgi:FMN phosphatase YigB (HAD superfamily)